MNEVSQRSSYCSNWHKRLGFLPTMTVPISACEWTPVGLGGLILQQALQPHASLKNKTLMCQKKVETSNLVGTII
jgi:hypothetical protein